MSRGCTRRTRPGPIDAAVATVHRAKTTTSVTCRLAEGSSISPDTKPTGAAADRWPRSTRIACMFVGVVYAGQGGGPRLEASNLQ